MTAIDADVGAAAPYPGQTARGAELAADARAWEQVLVFWHVAFYLLTGFTAVAFVAHGAQAAGGWPARDVVALVTLALLVVAYLTIGRHAARSSIADLDDPRGPVYLTILITATTVVSGADTLGTMMLFVAFSQIWLFSRSMRSGATLCLVLTVLVTVALLFRLRESGDDPAVVTIAQMALAFVFSLLMGLWQHTIIRQGAQRAQLLAQLEDAQEELGRTQHAAGVAAERERLAQEIHDTLAQGFTSIVMLSQVAAAQLEHGTVPEVGRRLGEIESTARENLAEARALVAAFAPAPLDDATLAQALTRLTARLAAETGLSATTDLDDAGLPSSTEVILLRAAQEALSNVRRHAAASTVDLTLRVSAEQAVLTVSDDGVGISPGTAEGFGMRGMRDRASADGGSVTVGQRQGRGTSVTVVVPASRAPGTSFTRLPEARHVLGPTQPSLDPGAASHDG